MKTESLIQERRDESSRDSHPKQNEPKRFGLKEFLIFSYIAPLFLVFVYYLSPHLQTAMLFVTMYVLFFGMIVGTMGTIITLMASSAVWAFSRKSVEDKRKDQIVLMKMLTTFVAISAGPPLIAFALIMCLTWATS